jgi:hypothetical protein
MAKTILLKDATEKYLEQLEKEGRSPSTLGTATRTLRMFCGSLGDGKQLDETLPAQVARFLQNEGATMPNGGARATASAEQIARIVRQFFGWCVESKRLAASPMPASKTATATAGALAAQRAAPSAGKKAPKAPPQKTITRKAKAKAKAGTAAPASAVEAASEAAAAPG